MTNSPVPRGQLESDRSRLNDLLGRAYAGGQLDLADYHALQDELFSAGTRAELARVGERLPAQYRFGDPAGAANGVDLAPGQINEPAARPGSASLARVSLGVALGLCAAVLAVVVLLLTVLL